MKNIPLGLALLLALSLAAPRAAYAANQVVSDCGDYGGAIISYGQKRILSTVA